MKKSALMIYFIFSIMMFSSSCQNETVRLFTGIYIGAGEKGLYAFDMDCKNGTLKLISTSDAGPNPSYFCISKKHGMIYAANEVMKFKGSPGGGLTALKYDAKTGVAEKVNEINVPNGGPCFISLSSDEDFLFLANYSGGSAAVVKLDDKGIPLSVTDTIIYEQQGEKKSHAHMISPDPSGKRIYVTDLGFDRVVIYELNKVSGKLDQLQNGLASLQEGAGPRHFVFNASGTKMYVINELNSTVSVFNVDENGGLQAMQTLTTLREGFKGESFCADIHIGKNGDFLYGSNRGENTIVTFRIGADGTLTLAGHTSCGGDWPRNFVVDPSGKYLLVGNQRSDNISIFKIDEKTGMPVEHGNDFKLTAPVCLKFSD